MWPFSKKEKRSNTIGIKNSHMVFDYDSNVIVNPDKNNKVVSIYEIPAAWAAIDFLSGTLASLPLSVHNELDHKELPDDPAAKLLKRTPAPGFTSFDWRYAIWKNLFTAGCSITFIDRNKSGRLKRLHWNIDPSHIVREIRPSGKMVYIYSQPGGGRKEWAAEKVIDIAWMRSIDGLKTLSPLNCHHDTFVKAALFSQYESRFAETGGMPAFALKGRWGQTQKALEEEHKKFLTLARAIMSRGEQVVPIGRDMDIQALGVSPEQARIQESKQFIVREICRIFGIPPIYLHDLDRMTYSNAEHQALTLTKYTINRWTRQLEEQISNKMLGTGRIARHNMDDLLRGDYATRIQGHSTAIMSGQLTPNEARFMEDRSPLDHGDQLFMQSGTLPIEDAENIMPAGNPNNQQGGDDAE